MDADRRQDEPAAEARGGREERLTRPDPLQPFAREGGRQAERDDGEVEKYSIRGR